MKAPILITGGATRLGLALTEYYLKLERRVVITYRTKYQSIENFKKKGVQCYYADFSSGEGIKLATKTLVSALPALSGIIHNASSWRDDGDNDQYDELLIDMMRVHVSAPRQITFALEPALKKEKNPFVISIADHVGTRGSANHTAYAASKAALINLSTSMARRFAPRIRVNVISPALLAFNRTDSENHKKSTLNKSALKIEPGFDVAIDAVRYLENAIYSSGSVIPLDGGRPLLMP